MVSIISSYTIPPSEPTPKHCLSLSESDQIVPWTHAPSIYIYKHNDIPQVIGGMRNSLAKILVHYYPLAGRLRWIGDSERLELDCNAMGVKFLEAESTKLLAEYGGFEPNETIKELIPMLDYSKPIEELPLFLVQVTKFQCGGLSVGVAMSSVIADGTAAIHFINSWAKLARGDTLMEDEMPLLDRTILVKQYSHQVTELPRFDHKEFKPLPLLLGFSDNLEERKKETSVALLKLTREQVEKLKNDANEITMKEEMSSSSSRPYSRYEAIAAKVWKCVAKARQGDALQPSAVRVVADIRNRLKPPLPRNYFGNAIVRTVTPTCVSKDLISKPFGYAAQKIREAVDVLTDEFIRSQLKFVKSQKHVDWLRGSFNTLGCMHAQFLGNPNLHIVSWMSMPVYGADFGWAEPVFMGPGALSADGKTFIIPSSDQDGSILVAIRLQTAHMEAFKKDFYQGI